MANKKKLLDRLNNAIKQVQAFAKEETRHPSKMEDLGSADFDWGFAPVVTDGKVNVGFKKSGMTPDEVLGEGVQGPVDTRKYYKTQYISPEGNITRTAVYPGSYSWNTGKNGLAMTRFTPEKGHSGLVIGRDGLDAVSIQGKSKTARPEGKWLKDSNGNWYKSKNGLEIPLEEAREMKKYWISDGGKMFDGVNMRGKKGETRVVDQDDQLRMMREARSTNKYNGYYGDRLAPNEIGETFAYREALSNADAARTGALDNQIYYTYSMNNERKAAIREQIAALQAQLNNISDEESQVRKEYQNMRDGIRKYSNGAPWHKAPEDAE